MPTIENQMAKLQVKTPGVENPVLELQLGVNRVGRSPDSHLRIDHPTVSSTHCEVLVTEDAMLLRDCGSTNGTYVNGQRVMEAALHAGETFVLGNVEVVVETTAVTVAIPQFEKAQIAPPVLLPDGAMLCPQHPEVRATYQCTQCHAVMCEACLHRMKRRGGQSFDLCPHCSGHCKSLVAAPEPPKKKSLLDHLKKTLKVPTTHSRRR